LHDRYIAELLGAKKADELAKAIKSGKTVIVSGVDGSGKTTLANVLKKRGVCVHEDFEVYQLTLEKPLAYMEQNKFAIVVSEQGDF